MLMQSWHVNAQSPLVAQWTFASSDSLHWLPAQVPGSVHLDLMREGVIPDPFLSTHEHDVQWVETKDWVYLAHFDAQADWMSHAHVTFDFKGLDTYATVTLNGHPLLEADNMHRSWQVDVRPWIQATDNVMTVHFTSAIKAGLAAKADHALPVPCSNEPGDPNDRISPYLRKAQYHHGWDWSPRLLTSGIWRQIVVTPWSTRRVTGHRWTRLHLTADSAAYKLTLSTEGQGPLPPWSLGMPGAEVHTTAIPHERLVTWQSPQRWWPNNLGEAHRYPYEIQMAEQRIRGHVGLRSIQWHLPSESSQAMHVTVNGIPVFAMGANVIPADFFASRARAKQKALLIDAAKANMNMLRVWGGAVYPNEAFYQTCDSLGLMIWQDFMFACTMVPTNQAMNDNILKEAVEQVQRASLHPSVVLYCGNNESLTGWFKWGWQDAYQLNNADSLALWQAYDMVFHHLLPDAVAAQSDLSYWSSSPSASPGRLANAESGDQHAWDVWFNQAPLDSYKENPGRFVSEYGMQSLPSMPLIEAMNPAVTQWNSSTTDLAHRQRSFMPWLAAGMDGFRMMKHYQQKMGLQAKNFQEAVRHSQLVQGVALTTAIESHRRNKPQTMGSLYWQLNDVWPTVSWSTINHDGSWKLAQHMVKDAFKPCVVSLNLANDSIHVHVIADRRLAARGELRLTWTDVNGKSYWSSITPASLQASDNLQLISLPRKGHQAGEVLQASWHENGNLVDQSRLVIPIR